MPRNRVPVKERTRAILKVRVLIEGGMSEADAAKEMDVHPYVVRDWLRNASKYLEVEGPWKDVFEGKTWEDMPGVDRFSKCCNFSLFRRGKARIVDGEFQVISSGQWRTIGAIAGHKVKTKVFAGLRRRRKKKGIPDEATARVEDADLEWLGE